jgi:hypothetical protein
LHSVRPRDWGRIAIAGGIHLLNIAKKAALAVAVAGIAAGASAGAASADAGAGAAGLAAHSPGVGSGNLVQVPVHVPVNATGNSVNVIGLLNPTFGNASANN